MKKDIFGRTPEEVASAIKVYKALARDRSKRSDSPLCQKEADYWKRCAKRGYRSRF